ncbi:hypothetical protein Ade02nite_47660 [Paractinoplanes deccanensis]|uniref:Uncharacterized protein n=1 Tax=Paractinoplanes deccanensis TaxID=113561 RepID=A0ABQ3Y8E2_9ACTN|nr:hypothetical protein [Actinoplanes deccanensis]GID76125.1 hypothetical protein Ade02nite_47660 [Actinoplanes deccanensis]
MRVKRFLAGTAAGATALAFAGACAQQITKLEPKLELRNAASQLSEAKQTGFTVKLTGSPEDLAAGLKIQDPSDVPDTATLQKIFNSSFTIATDKAGEGDKDDRASISATIDGVTGTEIRVIDGVVYAKAPVAELAQKFGAGDVTALRKEAVAELPEAGALFDGKWVSIDAAKAAEGALGGAATPTEDPAQAAKLKSEIETSAKNLFESAQIVRDSADPTHLTVTSSTTKGYEELKRLASALGKELGTDVAKDLPKAPKERPIILDLWIKDEKLTAIEVNFLQFIDGATGRAALRFEVTTGAEISAPEGATKIDPSKLTAGLMASQPYAGGGLDAGDLTGGDTAYTEARLLGLDVQIAMLEQDSAAAALKQAVADRNAEGDGVKAGIVRSGVAQVAADGQYACLKVAKGKQPVVTKGAC